MRRLNLICAVFTSVKIKPYLKNHFPKKYLFI